MAVVGDIPIQYRILALIQERNRLFSYPLWGIAKNIRGAGFRCTCCGACCTRVVNNHIFLLDQDVTAVRTIDPDAYEPAPNPEFCDQNGMLYVSGYALRMKKDIKGSCWFLKNGRCRIYDRRFSGCRIYPHMLRRSADVTGQITWREFARSGSHGKYDTALTAEECCMIARNVKEYENAYLTQQISFLETIHEYFTMHNLHHDPITYARQIGRISSGRPVDIRVFHAGELESCRIAVSG